MNELTTSAGLGAPGRRETRPTTAHVRLMPNRSLSEQPESGQQRLSQTLSSKRGSKHLSPGAASRTILHQHGGWREMKRAEGSQCNSAGLEVALARSRTRSAEWVRPSRWRAHSD